MQNYQGGTYSSAIAAVPSDTVPTSCRAIYVGGAGNVAIKQGPLSNPSTAVVFTAPPVGSIIPVELNEGFLMATGTTATNLVLLA